jgi:predicted Rossmann fold nucleotide-binding protein DprA/Smf involved in DNA uptake
LEGAEIISGAYSPSDSPSGARAKRQGGRGFYADRNRPYQEQRKPRHEYRDQHRSPEERKAAALGRQLAELAKTYPRYRGALNRLRHHVLVQARSEDWKCQAVLGCLSSEPVTIEEVVEETNLDARNIEQALATLEAKGDVEKCNRNGGAIVIRKNNKPSEKVHYLRSNTCFRPPSTQPPHNKSL